MASQISKIIKSDTPPINTRTLWLDTKSNQLKSFTPSGWNYVGSDLSKYAKTSEENAFTKKQTFNKGIEFSSSPSSSIKLIDIDNGTLQVGGYIRAYGAAPYSPYDSNNNVLTVGSLNYSWNIQGSWYFSTPPKISGAYWGDEIRMSVTFESNTSSLAFSTQQSNRDGVAITGISKVLDDNTSVTNKEYVDNLISSLQETINALTQRIANLEAPANNS